MKRLGIRVDANAQIGIGHLFRCLRLAHHAREHFETITFIAHNPSDFYHNKVQEHGFDLITIKNQNDLSFLNTHNYNYLLKDHYSLDLSWEEHARTKTSKFIVMDDRADQKHACDVYINQNPVTIIQSNLPDDCMILDGLRYAILPDSLLDHKNKPSGNDILISLGGSDPTNELQKCLTAFANMSGYHFHFIAGKENPNASEIEEVCNTTPHYTYHHFVEDIHALAATSLACITAGGTLLRELIYTQTPCYLITNHDVQIPIAEYFESQNTLFYAGHHTIITTENIKTSFTSFINDHDNLALYKQNMESLIDGKGLSRLTNAITTPELTLRPATIDDCESIYDWRNHPITRQYSADSEEIRYDEHINWYERKLLDKNTYIFIAATNDQNIGVLRYDTTPEGLVVSLYLSPDHHGHGYGASILLAGAKALKEKGLTPVALIAKILEINKASQNAFKKAGFIQTTADSWKKDLS